MLFKKLTSNNTIQVTVTTTGTSLQSLMQTVDSTQIFEPDLDTIWINPESAIRWAVYNTPTTTKGMQLQSGSTAVLTGVHPRDLYLVINSGTAPCNVQVGRSAMI